MPNKKQKKIKPYLIYSAWKRERVSSLIQLGEIKSRKDSRAIEARTKYDFYKQQKHNYYVHKLKPKLAEKYNEISKHTKKIQNIAKKNIREKLKQFDYPEETIAAILSQRNVIEIINKAHDSIESKKIEKKLIRHRKGKTYDYETKTWYDDVNYSRRINVKKYWNKIKILGKSLEDTGISINEIRSMYKFGGDKVFEGLTELTTRDGEFIYPVDFASPEEMREYWGKIKNWAKELNMPIPKVRNICKHFGEDYFIKRGK